MSQPPADDPKIAPRTAQAAAMSIPDQLRNPDSPLVADAHTRTCPLCKAPPGKPCLNPIRPGQPLPGRLVHLARREWDRILQAIQETRTIPSFDNGRPDD